VKLLVLGGGVAGLATALATSRGGHEVVLLERDAGAPAGGDAAQVFESWQRTGVAQFQQPHNFVGLGRRLLRDRAPDVSCDLLAAGAVEVEQLRFLAGATRQLGDEDLATIGCRRPVFEAVLRRAVEAEPSVDVRAGCRVTGLALAGGRSPSPTPSSSGTIAPSACASCRRPGIGSSAPFAIPMRSCGRRATYLVSRPGRMVTSPCRSPQSCRWAR